MKNFLIGILLIAVIILGYLQFKHNEDTKSEVNPSDNSGQTANNSSNPGNQGNLSWSNIPNTEIANVISKAYSAIGLSSVSEQDISFEKLIDANNDGMQDAIYSIGGGPSGNTAVLLVFDSSGSPVVAERKDPDGHLYPVEFTTAESLKYQVEYGLLGGGAYYTYEKDATSSIGNYVCKSFEVYKWNADTKYFEQDQALAEKYKPQFCQYK